MTTRFRRLGLAAVAIALLAVSSLFLQSQNAPVKPKPPMANLPFADSATLDVQPPEARAAGGTWDRMTITFWDENQRRMLTVVESNASDLREFPARMIVGAGYVVSFRSLPDWDPPADRQIAFAGIKMTIVAQYRKKTGALRVVIQPAEVAAAGAKWAVDEMSPMMASGETGRPLVGTYNLIYDHYDWTRWNPPVGAPVRVTANTTTNYTATFTRK